MTDGLPIRSQTNSPPTIALQQVGRYETGQFAEDAAEIVAYDPATCRLFVVNAEAGGVDVIDASDPTAPDGLGTIAVADAWPEAGETTNVAFRENTLVVAVEADPPQEPGCLVVYRTDGTNGIESFEARATVTVGAMPDMVTFTLDGERLLVACAGEPDASYETDPPGVVGVVDLRDGVGDLSASLVDCSAFDGQEAELRERGVRIYGPGASVSEDLEFEYLTIGAEGHYAYAVCQPNNAIAIFDIENEAFTDVVALGSKDHSLPGNELDASDRGGTHICNWPVQGLYQPDAIASYEAGGIEYLVTANEGYYRSYEGFEEAARVQDIDPAPEAFDLEAIAGIESVEELIRPGNLGNLKVSTVSGDIDGDGRFEELYAFGGRSFSVWTTDGELVFDSGNDFELLAALHHPRYVNVDGTANTAHARSPEHGPEPEGIELGAVGDRTYAFVGLERVGAIVVYDVSDPHTPEFVQYVHQRDFEVEPETEIAGGEKDASAAGDLGPEGLKFVSAGESPTDDPLLVVANELSGTTTIYAVRSIGES